MFEKGGMKLHLQKKEGIFGLACSMAPNEVHQKVKRDPYKEGLQVGLKMAGWH